MHGPHWNEGRIESLPNPIKGSVVDAQYDVQESPEHPSTVADLRAIVAYIAYRVLQSEFDYSEHDLRIAYPQLRGITSEQLRAAIQEGLA